MQMTRPALFSWLALTACAATPDALDGSLVRPAEGDPNVRAFDFWIGAWECYDPQGNLAGTNTVTLDWNERVLQEHWQGVQGGTGTSINMYDPTLGIWHQTWMGDGGYLLRLDGGLDDEGRMVLEGTRPLQTGDGEALHRIVWTPEGENVHQKWTYTTDGGATWGVAADLVYKPAGRAD